MREACFQSPVPALVGLGVETDTPVEIWESVSPELHFIRLLNENNDSTFVQS
jgi:hypothetical protein